MTDTAARNLRPHLQAIGGVRVTTSLKDLQRLQTKLITLKDENQSLKSVITFEKEMSDFYSKRYHAAMAELDTYKDKEREECEEKDA